MKIFKGILIHLLIVYQNFILVNSYKFTRLFGSTQSPCNDFYKYACSNYSQENLDPNYSEITQKLDYEMNILLMNRMQYLAVKERNNNMFIYLESCKKETRRNLKKYFDEIKPSAQLNWPLLEAHKGQWWGADINFDYWSLLGQMQAYGFNNVIVKNEIIRNKNNTLNIWLKPADDNDEDDFLTEESILKTLLRGLGIQDTKSIIKQLKKTACEWQQFSKDYTKSSDIIELTYKDLNLLYPKLNLPTYIEQLLSSSHGLENISSIFIEHREYFEFLNHKSWTKEELENICNYLMLKFLYYVAKDSTEEFTPLECIKDLRNKFDLAVNVFYYERFFQYWSFKYTTVFNEMFQNIKETMTKYFEENHLNLSSQQVNFLKDKLKAININIGNLPKNYNNNNTIFEFYQDLSALDRENYYKNHLLLLKHRFKKSLLYNQNQTYYIVTSNRLGSISTPFYLPQKNMVIIPFATLQNNFFHYNHTPLQQLSLLGFVLAHELTHAFDTTGLLFDKEGLPLDTRQSSIMENEQFFNSLNCMEEQQSTVDIDERISDLFAVRVIYRCYRDYYAKSQEDWEKDLFKNLAQFFCGKNNIKFIDHDSDPIRLQQIVKNFSPFAKAFECSEESPMNPRKKCRLY